MTVEDRAKDGRTVQLKNVRLSFTDTLRDKAAAKVGPGEEARPTHGCNVILPADTPEYEVNKKKVMGAIAAACEVTWKNPEKWKAIVKKNPQRVCFRKGESFTNAEGDVYAGYEGNHAFSGKGPGKPSGDKRPKLLDRRKREVEYDDIDAVFYSGVYADVIVSFYGTDKGSAGVFCTIDAIRSREEGEALGGRGVRVDADDFDDLDDEDDDDFDTSDDDVLDDDDDLI